MSGEDRIERARLLYERAVFGGDTSVLAAADDELDAVEAGLALARGRLVHARFLDRREAAPQEAREMADPAELDLFERAAELYRKLGDARGEAEALLWIGIFHQLVRGDGEAALGPLERSRALAAETGDALTLSYTLRHLGFAEHMAGRLEAARELLEESTRLRRELGFLPGVAANLVGLAYLASGQDRRRDAVALIEEAGAIAEAAGAHGIQRQVQQARARL
ncbi:tetratricopeptide repeat protein [Sphaerisporangium melleum]|nr:tetratricopeptide repeat protein [Sphaerisporangium melleum]